jgi:ankyrin repeat protein
VRDMFNSIVSGDWSKLFEFLDAGGDINVRDRDGRTPLMNAILKNELDVAVTLIGRQASINAQDFLGFTALHLAATDSLFDAAKFLVESGADVDIEDSYGNTPLFRAVVNSRGRGELIQLLIGHRADKNHKNHHGVSPSDLANTIANYDVKQFI